MSAASELIENDEMSCPKCGHPLVTLASEGLPPAALYHPWHVRNRAAVEAYVETLAEETHEWLLALYVDDDLNLLSVHTIAKGSIGGCTVNLGHIFAQGSARGAAAYILVHNHPSGNATPSPQDVFVTARLARLSAELDMPLLDHFIVASGGVQSVNANW